MNKTDCEYLGLAYLLLDIKHIVSGSKFNQVSPLMPASYNCPTFFAFFFSAIIYLFFWYIL